MILLVSYQPDGYSESQITELMPSESYEVGELDEYREHISELATQEIINAACDMWRHHLPSEDQILSRRLAREIQRANGSQWVTLQPERFADLVRAAAMEELELRLQIECRPIQNSSPEDNREGARSPSTLELSTSGSSRRALNHGPHIFTDGFNGFANELPPNTITPLTPQSAFRLHSDQSSVSSGSKSTKILSPIQPPRTDDATDTVPPAFDEGVAAFLAGRHSESRARFQEAALAFHERGDTYREADCLRHLGMSCRLLKDFVAARSHLLTARALYDSLGPKSRQEQLRCARHLARVEEDSGNIQVALIAYQELLRAAEQEGLVVQHAWCAYYLGHLYNQTKRYNEALNLLKDVVNTSREIAHGEIEAFATEESGFTAERQGHPQLAMNCYERALNLFKTHGNGKWAENENRVKKRMDQLGRVFPTLFKTTASRKWSIGAKLLNRG